MQRVTIPEDGWVLVFGDQRALLLRNLGDAGAPLVKAQKMLLAGACGCCAADGEHDLSRRAADAVQELRRRGDMRSLVIIASPRRLDRLRGALDPGTRELVRLEIADELTDRPIHRIEGLLSGP